MAVGGGRSQVISSGANSDRVSGVVSLMALPVPPGVSERASLGTGDAWPSSGTTTASGAGGNVRRGGSPKVDN